jgi:glycosyltransferase involved in cell wall biosynthesis
MRVVLSVDALTPVLTGIGRYTWELTTGLPNQLGADQVHYFHQGRWVQDPALLKQAVQPLPKNQKRTQKRLKISSPRWFRELRLKWACRGKVFHGPNYYLPPCTDIGVVTVHDLSVFKFPETHPAARLRKFEREFGNTIARAAHLITDSEVIRQEVAEFLAWPADKITTVPLGVSAEFFPRPREVLVPYLSKYGLTGDGYVLCVSTLEPRKNIDNLLQAYQSLPPNLRSRFPLILAGSIGWLSDSLHEKIDRYTRQGWLRYLGFVPEADLPVLYAGAHLFALPSSYEGFGLPVLEAMASGTPVVTSNRSSLPEITQGAALLVDPDDVGELRELITKGLCDEGWRSAARSMGVTIAQGYSWERCIRQTISVYEHILS